MYQETLFKEGVWSFLELTIHFIIFWKPEKLDVWNSNKLAYFTGF
jgi:hypothetical protein